MCRNQRRRWKVDNCSCPRDPMREAITQRAVHSESSKEWNRWINWWSREICLNLNHQNELSEVIAKLPKGTYRLGNNYRHPGAAACIDSGVAMDICLTSTMWSTRHHWIIYTSNFCPRWKDKLLKHPSDFSSQLTGDKLLQSSSVVELSTQIKSKWRCISNIVEWFKHVKS